MKRTIHDPRGRAPFILTLLITILLAGTARAQEAIDKAIWTPVYENWYTLSIAGSPIGWVHETVLTDGERFSTNAESKMKISRGPTELAIATTSKFFESKDGRPLELHYEGNMAKQKTSSRWIFKDDHILSVSRQGDREITTEIPMPDKNWLTPRAIKQLTQEKLAEGAETIEYSMMTGESGITPIDVKHEFVGREEMTIDEKIIPVTVWKTTSSLMPTIVATDKFSDDATLLLDEMPTGLGMIVTRKVTEAEARAVGAAPAPEMMLVSFIEVPKPIRNARKSTTSTMKLRVKNGTMPELPSAGAQRVEMGDDGTSAIVRQDVHDNLPATDEEIASAAYLKPSTMADGDDPLIQKLAARAVRDVSEDPFAKAEAIRAFVHEYISAKGLETAFATASETAKMRRGDCSEHGVLTCAMIRAVGIPARVATGLVYADAFVGEKRIFGWHMWTQALVDGKWVDFDATLKDRYDAVHVLTATSSLAEDEGMNDLMTLMALLGNLEIEVVEVGHAEPAHAQ